MDISPEAADALFDKIVASVTAGQRAAAISLAVSALAQGLDEPLVLLLAAEAREQQGQAVEALGLLRKAADIAPDEADVWYNLGAALLRQDAVTDGLHAFEQALALQPDHLPALTGAARVSFRLGRLSGAEEYYRKALVLAPQDAQCLAALAALVARRGRPQQARELAEQALALQDDNATAEIALPRADLIGENVANACLRMTRLLANGRLNDSQKVAALDLRAEALDALDRPAEAFADYVARNNLIRAPFAARLQTIVDERRIDQALRLATYFERASAGIWRQPPIATRCTDLPRQHVFLLGFPRSGTTLLEKVLGHHTAAVTLPEIDHLGAVASHWLADHAALDALGHLSAHDAAHARDRYWVAVRKTVGRDLRDIVLIDKLPLHTISLPIIAKLFPDARILFALRDPRDVVLSCFRRRFQINSAMFEFLDLQDAAHYYAAIMKLGLLYRDLLPLAVQEVHHEALVQDFELTIHTVLDFVGLDWEPTLWRFTDNLTADPRTPSDMQLRGGLNADGIAQRRRYAAQLEPVFGILRPWVQRFRYASVV